MLNEEKGELVAEAVINNNSDMNFNSVFLNLVEGNLNKASMAKPLSEKLYRNSVMQKTILLHLR